MGVNVIKTYLKSTWNTKLTCHREEQSNKAIQQVFDHIQKMDCFPPRCALSALRLCG